MRRQWLVVLLVASASVAHAQEDEDEGVATPGPDQSPPGPATKDPTPSVQGNGDQRRAVRGAPIPENADDPLRRALREFEEEAFGGRGTTPSPAEGGAAPARPSGRLGKEALPDELRSPEHASRPATRRAQPTAPSWLRGVKLGDLPVRWDPRVVRYLEFYKDDPRGRSIMTAWIKAKGRYERMISEALRRHRLPQDLIYLCMIESSFDSKEYSRVGASGLWQFMPSGTVVYGLRMDYWVDERNDPVKATEAAMEYWKDLYERFGSWHLALAAYNAGFGAVLKSMAKYNTNDFWTLLELEGGLPWESSIYVPKALAAAVVGHNASLFGYADVAADPPFEYDLVRIEKSVPLASIAKAAGVAASVVTDLNPQLRRGRTPPGGYGVRIPKGTKDTLSRAFPQLRADWDAYDAYIVRHGERFEDIAKTYGVSVKALRELNGVSDVAEVRGGTTIVVPKIDEASRRKNRAAAEVDLYRSEVAPGGPDDPMIVAVPDKDFSIPGRKRVFYRVVAGDTLESVSAVFAVRPSDLAAWNDLDPEAKIQARMVMVAYVEPAFDAEKAQVALLDESRLMVVTVASAEHLDLFEGRKGRVRRKIKVKAGDTLESLGRPHHLTKYDMARINRRSYYTPLVAGEELVVYAVVDKAKAKKAGVYDPPKRQIAKRKTKKRASPRFVVEGRRRADAVVAEKLPGRGRKRIAEAFAAGRIRVNGRAARKGQLVGPGDVVEVAEDAPELAEAGAAAGAAAGPAARGAVRRCRAGRGRQGARMPSHPLGAGETGTLANALVARHPECAEAGADPREGELVHRLDAGTSGVIVAARSAEAWRTLRAAFHQGAHPKEYLALVIGEVTRDGELDLPIAQVGGRAVVSAMPKAGALPARTTWRPERRFAGYTLLRCELEVGRMHQIRAHLAFAGHPVVGDTLYGTSTELDAFLLGHFLHASRLLLDSPAGPRGLRIEAPLPPDRLRALEAVP